MLSFASLSSSERDTDNVQAALFRAMTAEAAFTGVDATISIASNRRGHCDGCDSQGEAHCRLRKVVLGSAMNVTLSADSHAGNGLRHKVMCHAVSMTEKTTLKFEYNYADVEPLCPVETQKGISNAHNRVQRNHWCHNILACSRRWSNMQTL